MAKKTISFALVAFVALFGFARSSSGMTQVAGSTSPWIASDKADYAPGSTVHLTGGNWAPGEEVRIVTNDTAGNTWSQADTVTADGSGAIVDDVALPNYFVSDYTVTATAQSGTATTTFTDAVNFQFLGKDGQAHTSAGAEEDFGSAVNATCPAGLTAKATGLGSGQSTSYAISYVSGYGDNAALSSPASRTVISPASGTFNGNGSTCTSLTISTTGLAAGTYHGELQMRNTGGATATTELYFFKLTVAATQQPTSISTVSGAGTYGGTASLTATLKSGTTPLSGKTISFTLSGTAVGSATTDASGVAVLGGVSLSGINAGTQNGAVGASFAGDSGFSAGSGSGNLSVAKAASTTTVTCPATSLTYDSSAKTPCTAAVTGGGGLNQSLSVSYANNTDAGTASASASYAGDANHDGSSGSSAFTIRKASSTTTVSCPASVPYDGSAKTPCSATATGVGGLNQAVAVTYSDNTDAGTAGASATFAGDANHDGSSGSQTFTIRKADQTITFDDAPFSAAYGQVFQVHPTASSGLAVALSGAPGVCSVTPDAIQLGVFDVQMLAGTGTCVLTASQAGSGNYNAAADVSRNVAASKANQSITFDALADKSYGDADFGVSASASSGLAVDFAAAGDCMLSGTTVHISGAGGCTITASQGGNGNYTAAADVARSFAITKAPSSVAVTCNAGPFSYTGSAHMPCSAKATGVGGLDQPLSVTYSDNVDAGTATASASYAGDANHLGDTGSATFTIDKAASGTTVTCPESRTYTGSAIEPCSAAASGAGGLDTALTVSYSGNVNAGPATASATFGGDDNHTGSSGSATFTIDKAASSVSVDCPDSRVYTGAAIEPCSAAATGAGDLDMTLSVSYSDNVNAGTATASAAFDGDANHNGDSGSATFTIEKAPSAVTVTCPDSRTYTGGAIEPCSAKATGAGGLDVDLTPSYSNNVGAGTATAAAAYAGDTNHTADSGSATFTIEKAQSSTTVTCPDSRIYTGSAIEPCTARATGAGGLDTAVAVSYSDNVNAGTATAAATYGGDGNHTASTGSATFTIEKAPSTVTVSCPDSRTYTGSALEPCSATATGAGALDVALAISYSDNVDAGTATASATYGGDANHTGSSGSSTFTIDKAPSHVTVSCADGPFTYTGSAHTPCSAKAAGAGGLDADLAVGYSDNVDAGTATASASYDGDANHTGDGDSETFTIDKAGSSVTVSCADGPFTYNGSPHTPCSAGVTGAGGLDQSLAVGYSDNVNAGTATAAATYAGDANHTGDSASKTFAIEKAASSTTVTCPDSRTYTGSAIEPCTAKATGAGSLDTAVGISYGDNVNAGTATASATYGGDSNHFGSAGSASFTITKAPSTVTVTCGAGPFTYNGLPQTPCSAKATGAGGLDTALTVSYSDNVNAGTPTASATYAGDANHLGDSSSKTFTIGKATPTVSVTWSSWTYDGAAHPATGSVTGVGGASLGSPTFTYYNGNTASGTPLGGAPSGVGAYTVLASFAGNSNYTAASKTKTVSGLYRWDGFLQPINDTAHQGLFESSFKLGSTIPAKFQLKKADGTVVQAGTLPVFSRSTTPVSCDTQISAETLDTDVAFTGTTFRWDSSQYIYNWSTKGLKAGEYRIYATLDDGSKQYVDICLQ